MKTKSIVSLCVAMLAIPSLLFAVPVYRYEWQAQGALAPTPQGEPFSGFLEFATPTSESIEIAIDTTVNFFALGFTSWPSMDPTKPFIPSVTYSLADRHHAVLAVLLWNEFTADGIFAISFAGEDNLSLARSFVEGRHLHTHWPSDYAQTSIFQAGNWMFTGIVERPLQVPDAGSTAVMLLTSLAGLIICLAKIPDLA